LDHNIIAEQSCAQHFEVNKPYLYAGAAQNSTVNYQTIIMCKRAKWFCFRCKRLILDGTRACAPKIREGMCERRMDPLERRQHLDEYLGPEDTIYQLCKDSYCQKHTLEYPD
jgi:hypothetical protein